MTKLIHEKLAARAFKIIVNKLSFQAFIHVYLDNNREKSYSLTIFHDYYATSKNIFSAN